MPMAAITPVSAATTPTTDAQALNDGIQNFALSLAQSLREDDDKLNERLDKMREDIKQESP